MQFSPATMAMTMFGNHDFTPILLPVVCLWDVRDARKVSTMMLHL